MSSRQLIFAAHGTWGDVGPLAALAAHLQRRGAQVTFISTPFFEDGLRQRGLTPRLVGERWDPAEALHDPRLSHPLTGPLHIWRLVYLPLLSLMFEATTDALLPGVPGAVVLHPWCFGAQLAAEAAGLPWAMTALAPVTWFSAAAPPVTGPLTLPSWLARALMAGPIHAALRRVFNPDLRAEATRRGLPPHPDRFFGATRRAALNLAFWPAALRPPATDDPPHALLCGFPHAPDPTSPLPPGVEDFLQGGEPPIVLGLGSALPAIAADVYAAADVALRQLGCRAIVVGDPTPRAPSPDLLHLPWAPYSALFPRARLIIHHGGIGTTAEALAAARPQLVIPFGADQYDNAHHIQRLGLGLTCNRRQATPARLTARLTQLLQPDPERDARAQQLAATLHAAPPGLEVASDALWRLSVGRA